MYSSHPMYPMPRQLTYQTLYNKVHQTIRNEQETKGQILSNHCLHTADHIQPDCSLCKESPVSREMMGKYFPEVQIPMYGFNIKGQDLESMNNSQCPPLSNDVLLSNKAYADAMPPGIHRYEPSGQNRFNCDICSKSFLEEPQLQEHKRSQCPNYQEDETDTKDVNQPKQMYGQVNCSICSTSVIQTTKEHAHGLKPFICSQCSKAFAQHTNLKNHQRIHTGEKPYECEVCHRLFSQQGNLNTHRRTHGGKKEFVCEICFKAFSQKGNLKNHSRTHTGERPYHCKQCGKTFSQHTDMRNHERVHTGEKPFICKVCSKPFSQRANLRIHGRTHTGEKPFGCNFCGKNFSQKGNLKSHIRTHGNDKRNTVLS